MSELAACLSCRRHVRVDEERCPFCGASERASGPVVSVGRTSRARLVALATSLGAAAVVAGCPSTQHASLYGGPPPPPAVDAAPPEEETGAVDDAQITAPTAPTEHPPVALYGAPPAPAK
jgi:hypothetical protein